MKLSYDEAKIREGLKSGAYDERNLAVCKCGEHKYPSKLMFIRFLEQFKDIPGTADIWSIQHLENGTVEIHVDVKYKVVPLKENNKGLNPAPTNRLGVSASVAALLCPTHTTALVREFSRVTACSNRRRSNLKEDP
jgi:hypothetical protein